MKYYKFNDLEIGDEFQYTSSDSIWKKVSRTHLIGLNFPQFGIHTVNDADLKANLILIKPIGEVIE